MKSLLTIVLACALLGIYAQTGLRPQEQIDVLRKGKSPFLRLALFPTNMLLKDAELPFAQGLTFQEGVAQSLLQHPYSAIEIDLPLQGKTVTLEMYRVELLSEDYTLKLADPRGGADEKTKGLHYRGVLKGIPGSLASLSIYGDEVLGMFSTLEEGNFTLAKYQSRQNKVKCLHVLYPEDQIPERHNFHCYTPDGQRGYSAQELEKTPEFRATNNCVNLSLEVDNDVFLDKGGLDATTRYIQAVFNQTATLYANENIKLNLSELYIWNTTSPYSEYDAYGLLSQFNNIRAGQIKGDAGLLLSYKGGGGLAVVDGLCDPFNLGYAGIGKSYSVAPAYSFTVMVLTHELGHILGSQHTHACVWNGNSTAIDGCAGFTDGACATPAIPKQGGTIMSYCHITQYGINFALGFGLQPGNLIRNRIARATCMSACQITPPPPPCGEVSFTLTLDAYGNETSYEILDANNVVVDKGGPYFIKSNGQIIKKKLCLPAGCYTLRVLDSQGDGLCCSFGNGSFSLLDSDASILAEGGRFAHLSVASFCIDKLGRKVTVVPPPPPDNNVGCININFNTFSVLSFGESQDQGSSAILENGNGLSLSGNSWKAIPLNRTITSNTFLEFEFRSTQKSEIHGIGFDNDMAINTYYTFQLAGTQVWGYQEFNTYVGFGGWKKYIIPVGQKYTGDTKYLFFVNDNDENFSPGNSQFRNVKIYETKPCSSSLNGLVSEAQPAPQVLASPNPAHQQLSLQLDYFPPGRYQVQVMDLLGKVIFHHNVIHSQGSSILDFSVNNLPVGMYIYQVKGKSIQQSGKFMVKHSK
ncbi:MAG: M12 family metallo-peptidase [Haliscomenobacter sp.]|uniref:M12 family metallo-peptidase n=1 Tax=Haliscomenobacter sp. TaxID=2717303 RepID=UPI0029A16FE6|nr:M12 family metallo-peptidase [Haliscomenobacter sp.]MDX2071353.1 M12 family metallo-peptidase [Haliscomenobacter sp.]